MTLQEKDNCIGVGVRRWRLGLHGHVNVCTHSKTTCRQVGVSLNLRLSGSFQWVVSQEAGDMSHSVSQVSFRSSHVLRHSYYGTMVGMVVYFVKKTMLCITHNCCWSVRKDFVRWILPTLQFHESHRDTVIEEMGGFSNHRYQKQICLLLAWWHS